MFSSSTRAADPQRRKEAAAILEKLTDRDLLILLDDKGRQFSSEEFAVQLSKLFNSGKSKIVMVNRRRILLWREPSEKSFYEALTFENEIYPPDGKNDIASTGLQSIDYFKERKISSLTTGKTFYPNRIDSLNQIVCNNFTSEWW